MTDAVSGVDEDAIQGILDSVVTNANDPQKLSPLYCLSPEVVELNGKNIIVVYVPEKFHLEGDQRINLRDRIFREVIGNVLIHREFTNPYPAKMAIEQDRVFTENWNKFQKMN